MDLNSAGPVALPHHWSAHSCRKDGEKLNKIKISIKRPEAKTSVSKQDPHRLFYFVLVKLYYSE